MNPTHYDVLEVAEHASPEVIEAAWKTLLRRYHPDGPGGDAEKCVQLNNAHDCLEDRERRRRYDLQLRQERAAQEPPQQSIPVDPYGWMNQQAAGYPAPYPPNILETMAMRMGSSVLRNLMDQNPELSVLIRMAAQTRRGRAA